MAEIKGKIMQVIDNELYKEDIKYISELNLPWDDLRNESILISGASGLVGSCLIDVIMHQNMHFNLNCKIYAMGRNVKKAAERFKYCWNNNLFSFIFHDINEPLNDENIGDVGFVLHMASNTHPVAYAINPIETITTNIIGVNNMLEFAVEHNVIRFVFASSNEIYGENRGDVELFDENYCGYINSNTLRAGYPESKRCGEALCQAYRKQKSLNLVIPRFTRSYGPTMLMSDTKAISQFIKKGIASEDIVLKSAGTQYYSYTYVCDAVAGLLTVLLCGKDGEAYNITDQKSDITLKNLAQIVAEVSGTKVVFESPDEIESTGYSTATKARLDGSKLIKLGWSAKYDIKFGMKRTIQILKEIYCGK